MKIVMKVGQGESFCALGSPVAEMPLSSKTLAPEPGPLSCCSGVFWILGKLRPGRLLPGAREASWVSSTEFHF